MISSIVKKMVALKAAAGPALPGARRDLEAPFSMPWHVRTLIYPIPKQNGIQLVFANIILGRVGVAGFDDPAQESLKGRQANLAVLALDSQSPRTGAFVFDESQVRCPEKATGYEIQTPDFFYRLSGSWPRYATDLRIPGWDFDLSLETECVQPVVWWSETPPFYSHYSAFGKTRGTGSFNGKTQVQDGWISLEHGQGKNLRSGRLILPAPMFHYQLGALETGEAFAFGCCTSMGVEVFRRGVFFTSEGKQLPISTWHMLNGSTQTIPDRLGGQIRVPDDFEIKATSPDLELSYKARLLTAPLAGSGRLTSSGAAFEGSLRLGSGASRKASGILYMEHLYGPKAKKPLP